MEAAISKSKWGASGTMGFQTTVAHNYWLTEPRKKDAEEPRKSRKIIFHV